MPYREFDGFEPPEEGTEIWRYLDFTKYVSLLESGSIYFSRADRLAELDPYEGRLTTPNAREALAPRQPEVEEAIRTHGCLTSEYLERYVREKRMVLGAFELIRQLHFINCWHMNDVESDAMWKLYARAGDGIAVKSTFRRLIESLEATEDPVYISKVKYVDFESEKIAWDTYLRPLVYKRRSFFHEQELRAVISRTHDVDPLFNRRDGSLATLEEHIAGAADATSINRYPRRYGIEVPCNLRKLVKEVYVSPTCQTWFKELVAKTTRKFGYEFAVQQSALADRPIV